MLLAIAWASVLWAGDYGVVRWYQSPEVTDGVVIAEVQPKSPAARAGLRAGDVILALNDVPASDETLFLAENSRLRWREPAVLRIQLAQIGLVRDFPLTLQPHLSAPNVLTEVTGLTIVGLLFVIVAVLVVVERPDDLAARLFFVGAGSLGISQTAAIWGGYGVHSPLVEYVEPWAFRLTLAVAMHLFLVFPEPHPVLQKLRSFGSPALRQYGGATAAIYAIPLIVALVLKPYPEMVQPWWNVFVAMWLALALVALIDNYRRLHDPLARAQTRLILVALAIAVAALVLWLVVEILPRIGMLIAASVFPVAVTIAILRYRLFDIDVVINRTLVYAVLTAILAAIYAGSIVVLQNVFRSFTGTTSNLAIVLSTLAIAALFNPLRQRIQTWTDRYFYRKKYRAVRAVAAFGASLRNEGYADIDLLTERLVAIVDETMQPSAIWLWLQPPEQD